MTAGAGDGPPRFSVIVPAYNAAATIAAAVGSALAQTTPDLEVIVVDDGSTDATVSVAEQIGDPRIRIVRQANRGLPGARNAGIAVARGGYVSLLDADDLLLPTYLERCDAALASAPDAGLAYTDAYVFDPVSGRVRRRTAMARANPPLPVPAGREQFLTELLQRNFIYVAATIRAAVLERVGGFAEHLGSAEDYDLWLRIVIAGYRAVAVTDPQALYRKHEGQMSRRLATMSRNLQTVYAGIDPGLLPSDAHRELLLDRRRRVALQTRILRAAGWMVPQGLITRLKRAGIGEQWYEQLPAPVAAAFSDLRGL
jgi:glycosyltransferase involved in cell wall biosynthesis